MKMWTLRPLAIVAFGIVVFAYWDAIRGNETATPGVLAGLTFLFVVLPMLLEYATARYRISWDGKTLTLRGPLGTRRIPAAAIDLLEVRGVLETRLVVRRKGRRAARVHADMFDADELAGLIGRVLVELPEKS